jgi:hypothetical protein
VQDVVFQVTRGQASYCVKARERRRLRKASRTLKKTFVYGSAAVLNFLLAACGPLLAINADPGTGVPGPAIVKSIRCEIMTFFVTNRYRRDAFTALYTTDFRRAFDEYAFLNLDDNEYGAIDANLKTVDSVSLTVGLDWKTKVDKFGRSHDKHLGPGLSGSKTYIVDNLFALAQDSRLGPTVAPANYNPSTPLPQSNKFYQDTDSGDIDFFCYKKDRDQPAPIVNLDVMEELANHELPQYENFDRIYVAGIPLVPLAKWLELKGAEMSQSYLAQGPYMESIFPGQLSYSFALEIKPSIDLKYTMIATVINPYVPEIMASRDDTDTFTIYLNTVTGKFASGGKTGGTAIYSPPPVLVWGPNQPGSIPIGESLPKSLLAKRGVQINSRKPAVTDNGVPIPAQPGWAREPGGVLLAPLPLIPPAVGPGQ